MKLIKVIRLLRLLKLIRAVKASRIFRRIEIGMSITYQKINLFKFFIILVLACHWQACAWAMTLQFVSESDGVPRWIDTITELETNVAVKTKDSTWKLYVASAYFAAYTMTSVGFGDISPLNIIERCVCLVLLFAAGITWAYIIGQVCSVVGTMGVAEQAFRKTMDDLNNMMQDRSVPYTMRRRLRKFFLNTRDTQRYASQRELFSKMSPALQGEVALITNQIWIEKVTFLGAVIKSSENEQEGSPPFLIEIALSLETHMYAQQEEFGRPHVLYIQSRGLTGRNVRVMRGGSVWGEDFVLTDSYLLDPVTCFALTYVEVSTLSRTTFLRIVKRNQFLYPMLHDCVRKFCVRLAFQRAILEEARERRIKLGDEDLRLARNRRYGRFDSFRALSNQNDLLVGMGAPLGPNSAATSSSIGKTRRELKADDLRHLELQGDEGNAHQDSAQATQKELVALRQEVFALRASQARTASVIERLAERMLQDDTAVSTRQHFPEE